MANVRSGSLGKICVAFCLLIAGIAVTHHAHATTDKTALRAQQTALFKQVFADPDNLELMFAYARVSAKLEDYEAAISTLERALGYNSDADDIRLELGALYFNMGLYRSAKAYFDTALTSGALAESQVKTVKQYQKEIARRTRRAWFSGEAVIGGLASSNASLDPSDPTILSFGAPVTGTGSEADAGVFADLSLRHDYDLGLNNTDIWRTDARATATEFFDETDGNSVSFGARTGPLLSLAPDQYGPKLRPFVEVDYVNVGSNSLYGTLGTGAVYSNTLSDRWAVFGELGGAYRFFVEEFEDEEGMIGTVTLGASYTPTRDLEFRGRLDVRGDRASRDFNSNVYAGARAEAVWRYNPGFAFAERKWELVGKVSLGVAEYDAADPAIDPNRARSDTVAAFELRHDFHLRDGFFIRAEGGAVLRESNIPNYDLSVYEAKLGVGVRF